MPIESAETQASSYRYLRIAIVGLLLALATAVFYQSSTQGSFLSSVSAYYYTSAQAVFVGSLIGLGTCMIALQGLTGAEDMFLNLGGMFAMVVAVIPTGRGKDFETAARACQQGAGTLTRGAAQKLDCPTVLALQNSARANAENNLAALLAVGGLALVLAGVVLFAGRTARSGWALAGFLAAALVWLAGLIGLVVSVGWIVGNAHYIAAGGLLAAILLVAGANAHRRGEKPSMGGLLTSPGDNLYTLTAIVMLAGAAVLIVLWLIHVISLFWVEILVALLFIVFWTVQTAELETVRRHSAKPREIAVSPADPADQAG